MSEPRAKYGFDLLDKQHISELKTDAFVFEHSKSGAKLIYIPSEDTNKVFCITFRTPPADNTGCPHILEHSVLNGSRNYPSKSPFNELLKGSMHTFLNAMTASDKTMYPIASTNAKDYLNLMDVYLDAVLNPNIYDNPMILEQEGWHYELFEADADLNIKGVVYNEMKGAFSSPDMLLARLAQQSLYPDNAYGFESGGDPVSIPELCQETFTAFHKQYYHPANSFIFLYGDLDIDAALTMIDSKYLSHFEKTSVDSSIMIHEAFAQPKTLRFDYPIDEGKDSSNQHYLSLNFSCATVHEVKDIVGLTLLTDILMNSPASPLKQKLLESGLAEDSYCYVDTRALQPSLYLVCKNVNESNLETLEQVIYAELQRLSVEGIDKKIIEAAINSKEFYLREAQMQGFPTGLYYNMLISNSWLYGGDPFVYLRYEPLLEHLKTGLTNPYFESLITKYLLENKYRSKLVLIPQPGLNARKEQELKDHLAEVKAGMSSEEIENLIKHNQDLIAWQNSPDKTEDIAKIPFLNLRDVKKTSDPVPCVREVWKEFTLLKHELPTNGIVYFKAYFDLAHAEEEDLPWISLYTYLCGQVDTQKFSYAELANEIDINTGGISLGLNLVNDYLDPDKVIAKICLSGKAVKAKSDDLIFLATEYALKPVFADVQRIKKLLTELKTRLESGFLMAGHSLAVQRLLSPFSQYHKWQDISGGLTMYHFLVDLLQDFEAKAEAVVEELEWVQETFFTQQKLIISLTGGEDEISIAFAKLTPMLAEISTEAYTPIDQVLPAKDFNEAIYGPMQVQYCAKGGNFFRKGFSYSGKLRVLNNILRNEYLYNKIRVKGGAYGIISNFSISGFHYLVSYRDPNLEKTFDVYDSIPEYLRSFQCSARDMEKYIIGVISGLDYPNTPEQKGFNSDEDYITGFTHQDRQQIRDEIFATKVDDIRGYADLVGAIMVKKHICVVGNENRIKAAEGLFHKLTPIFK